MRTTITISDALMAKAKDVMDARTFDDFSGFLQSLIREEHERRFGSPAKPEVGKAIALHEKPSEYHPERLPPLRTTAKK